jgi:hypothetical protein
MRFGRWGATLTKVHDDVLSEFAEDFCSRCPWTRKPRRAKTGCESCYTVNGKEFKVNAFQTFDRLRRVRVRFGLKRRSESRSITGLLLNGNVGVRRSMTDHIGPRSKLSASITRNFEL